MRCGTASSNPACSSGESGELTVRTKRRMGSPLSSRNISTVPLRRRKTLSAGSPSLKRICPSAKCLSVITAPFTRYAGALPDASRQPRSSVRQYPTVLRISIFPSSGCSTRSDSAEGGSIPWGPRVRISLPPAASHMNPLVAIDTGWPPLASATGISPCTCSNCSRSRSSEVQRGVPPLKSGVCLTRRHTGDQHGGDRFRGQRCGMRTGRDGDGWPKY
jgi:hypothetical protein